MFIKVLSPLILLVCLTGVFAQQETTNAPKTSSGEILNEKAISLPAPEYTRVAKAVAASSAVNVQVTIDENGDVINAQAVSGHPLLRASAVAAARQAKFLPAADKTTGLIVYIFVMPVWWREVGEALGNSEVEIETAEGLLKGSEWLIRFYPEIAAELRTISEKFNSDEESGRFQPIAIGDIIAQLQRKIPQSEGRVWFEFGLTLGRIKAYYFDETILRANLPKLKELAGLLPETESRYYLNEDGLESLKKLVEMADRPFFSRKDKSKVKKLLENL